MTTLADLAPGTRRRAVRLLRSRISLDDQDALRREIPGNPDWPRPYVGWGVQVCIVLEDELPDVDWHELWPAIVEEAVGARP